MFKTIFKGVRMYTLHSKHKVPERHIWFTVLAVMIISADRIDVVCAMSADSKWYCLIYSCLFGIAKTIIRCSWVELSCQNRDIIVFTKRRKKKRLNAFAVAAGHTGVVNKHKDGHCLVTGEEEQLKESAEKSPVFVWYSYSVSPGCGVSKYVMSSKIFWHRSKCCFSSFQPPIDCEDLMK